jgi:hypothetical protein
LEQGRQHLLSIAVVRRARERQPGSSDPGVGPRIEIFRDLRLACRTSERLHDGDAARGENIVPRGRGGHSRVSEPGDARYGPRIVHDAVHYGQAWHLQLLCEHQLLRHASAYVVASDHDRPAVPERVEETQQPGGKTRDRSLAYCELTSRAPEAGEVDRDRTKAGGGDAVEHRLPDAAPICAMKQEHQGGPLTGGEITDRNAAYVDCLTPRHRTILLTWFLPSPTAV